MDTPSGYKPETKCHRDEGCQDGEYCHKGVSSRELPPLPPILGTCKATPTTTENCPWHLECNGICCTEGEVCSYQYSTPHR